MHLRYPMCIKFKSVVTRYIFFLQVSYSHQLLKIADLFSDSGESGFALYFSELDYDSIVIDKDYKVHLIDPENLILVDRWQINKGKDGIVL